MEKERLNRKPESSARVLLVEYYRRLGSGEEWGSLLTEDFLLSGTVPKETRGRAAFVNANFFKMVKGVNVKELIVDGEKACALVNYDLISPRGKNFSSEVAEIWEVKEGKLASIEIFFDTEAFNKSLDVS
ncbi:MAG: nuclear transport factor 2 family protein [Conexivisphaerales archaeon]